jgi:hypothetical protein
MDIMQHETILSHHYTIVSLASTTLLGDNEKKNTGYHQKKWSFMPFHGPRHKNLLKNVIYLNVNFTSENH